jgi:signal transduction histidine kinase
MGPPDGILLIDVDHRIAAINPAGREILGDEVLGRDAAALRLPTLADRIPEDTILPIVGPSGSRLVSIRSRETASGLQLTLRDVTEQEASRGRERALLARTMQASKLEALGRLSGGVAHDFNNLLTIMLGNVHLLRSEGIDQNPEEYVEPIEAPIEAAARVTKQLLAFGRPHGGRVESVDVHQVVQRLARMLAPTLGGGSPLDVSCPESLWIEGVPANVEEVIVNLVVNAADAMPEGGSIQVSLSTAGDGEIALSVADTGTGMTLAVRETIFAPFFTTKQDGRGTGLGLSVVQTVVEQAGEVRPSCSSMTARPSRPASRHTEPPLGLVTAKWITQWSVDLYAVTDTLSGARRLGGGLGATEESSALML